MCPRMQRTIRMAPSGPSATSCPGSGWWAACCVSCTAATHTAACGLTRPASAGCGDAPGGSQAACRRPGCCQMAQATQRQVVAVVTPGCPCARQAAWQWQFLLVAGQPMWTGSAKPWRPANGHSLAARHNSAGMHGSYGGPASALRLPSWARPQHLAYCLQPRDAPALYVSAHLQAAVPQAGWTAQSPLSCCWCNGWRSAACADAHR